MICIRPMQPEDVDAVSALEQEIFSQPWSRQGFLDALALDYAVFLAAEEDGKILGYIGMYCSCEEGEITNVAVAPAERRRGIGGLLLQEIKKQAAERSLGSIVLEVRVSNENAIRLYQKNGFVLCGVRKGFYEFPKEDACIMLYGQ